MSKEYANAKGQSIGWLKEGVFRKKVRSSKHLLRIMDAWGIQSDVIEDLITLGCSEIRVKDEDTGTIYSISVDDFMEHQVERDYGDGKQRFVSRKYFTTE